MTERKLNLKELLYRFIKKTESDDETSDETDSGQVGTSSESMKIKLKPSNKKTPKNLKH